MMNDREEWLERVRDIRAGGTTMMIYIYIYICNIYIYIYIYIYNIRVDFNRFPEFFVQAFKIVVDS